ncbi:MAG: shikimate dehydrogenase [Oscillospiraceae bacterium]|nr:shikimate dehydrogenase [Oscillospiraceae bacterium]
MKKFGLIGNPLGHSLSPLIHSEILKRTGFDADYSLYEIKPEEFGVLAALDGFNVTIPYKETIIPFLDKLDESAVFENNGAVNCVKDKIGYNTDVFGFEKAIEALGADLGSRVCLLGHGGSGKMIADRVRTAGGELTIAVRDSIYALGGEFDLLINSTPVGMHPNVKDSPIDFENISAKYVLDLIYNPAETKLLSLAKKKGAKIMNGLIMLAWQAIKSHEIWYGGKISEQDADEIIQKITASLS